MSTTTDIQDAPLRQRIAEDPRPALAWGAVLAVLLALEFGAVLTASLDFLAALVDAIPFGLVGLTGVETALVGALGDALGAVRGVPTLLSRDLIPNQGWTRVPFREAGPLGWYGTFPRNLGAPVGLEPMLAWSLRVALVYAYAFALVYWLLRGYFVFREHYRYADWTPRDDVIDRLRGHRWGQFGFVVVLMFLTMALFAPTLGPTTVEKNIVSPYEHQIRYYDADTGEVTTTTPGAANLAAASQGNNKFTGIWSYDSYGRFHPFGTLPTPGKDLFTFMAAGSRVSLFIALVAIGISTLLAAVFGLVTAYYKGLVDLAVVVTGDSIMTIPQLLFLILISVVFADHWLGQIYNGGLLLALVFAFTGWPFLWRAVRGPAFQVAEEEWVDAARSYGQRARTTMRKHMLPYIVGYLLIYGSMTLGGIIITVSALSFLGIGIDPPTPEWGRAIAMGSDFVATKSWHIATVPGVLITLVVTALNAMGDGIRDAIDPQSESGESGTEAAAAAGGGG